MTGSTKARSSLALSLVGIVLWILSLLILLPLALVILTSFKNLQEGATLNLSWPQVFVPANYLTVFVDGKILGGVLNSLLVTSFATALILLCSALLGFVLTRRASRTSNVMMTLITLGLVAPFTALPTILLLKTLGIFGTHAALIAVYTAMFLPFTTMMMASFVKTLPQELDQAAIVDGASGPVLFWRIILPLLQAPLVTAFLLNAMWVWNDFMLPLYLLTSAEKWTLPLSVFSFFGKYNHSWQLISANMVIVSAPVTILYLFGQRFIISGMTAGAVKG